MCCAYGSATLRAFTFGMATAACMRCCVARTDTSIANWHERLYRKEGLQVRTKKRKKQVSRPRAKRAKPTAPNHHWSMNFMSRISLLMVAVLFSDVNGSF